MRKIWFNYGLLCKFHLWAKDGEPLDCTWTHWWSCPECARLGAPCLLLRFRLRTPGSTPLLLIQDLLKGHSFRQAFPCFSSHAPLQSLQKVVLLKAPCQHPAFSQGASSVMWLCPHVISVHPSFCCTWRSIWLPVAIWVPRAEYSTSELSTYLLHEWVDPSHFRCQVSIPNV